MTMGLLGRFLLGSALLCAAPALAQVQPDAADMQRIISILQLQRNAAQDQTALANAALQKEREENAALKSENERLKQPAKAEGEKK